MTLPRFVVGVDLGTTNTAAACADLGQVARQGVPRVEVFAVPQVVAEGEVAPRDTLPSFLLLPTPEERASGRFALAWSPAPDGVVGTFARDHGALVPGRLVSSAKSWLCHDAVDRRADILPWGADEGAARRSPVAASAAYLAHVREAWNHARAGGAAGSPLRFERQDLVLTVPASFDEEARELTVEAARAAGVERFTLVEEPTAALYAWIAAHQHALGDHLHDGDIVLVCDVGGGTSDFTLVRIRVEAGDLRFERTAVGEHLLLGGDNLDLAIARHVEEKLGRPRLTLSQQQNLRRQCAQAKERLLGPPPVARLTVSVLGSGRALVAGAMTCELTRDEVLALLLDGFLPGCDADAVPTLDRRAGLRELGLPFAADAAITRHLAAFLRQAGGDAGLRPDAVLFNGGFFTPVEARERLTTVVASWFAGSRPGWHPRVLANANPATAVAEGAAYAGLVRHGLGTRIGGGSPRAYFVALGGAASDDAAGRAVCVLPRGAQEGTTHLVEGREFLVATNRPLAFSLHSSLTRSDGLGAVVGLDDEHAHRHAPLVTELRYGKRSRQVEIPVVLEVHYTELGTLELWLLARQTDHRWRLQFQLRALRGETPERPGGTFDEAALERARALVGQVFGAAGQTGGAAPPGGTPETLMARLEEVLGFGKHAWPLGAVRPLADALLEVVEGRRRSARHEARWLNLAGYCLRPGYGAPLDDWRMTQLRRVYLAGLAFPGDVQCQAEWFVLWQRVAGGLSAGQQRELFDREASRLGIGTGKAPKRLAPQLEREGLRLLASLEHLDAATRARVGDHLLARLRREPRTGSLLWGLGRAGARWPVYGPLNTVVAPPRVEAWVVALAEAFPQPSDEVVSTVVQLAARTGDPARDLDEDTTRHLHDTWLAAGVDAQRLARLVEVEPPSEDDTARAVGERLPEGLKLADAPAHGT
jgi:molecular chaperone DnaK (HSP70)